MNGNKLWDHDEKERYSCTNLKLCPVFYIFTRFATSSLSQRTFGRLNNSANPSKLTAADESNLDINSM